MKVLSFVLFFLPSSFANRSVIIGDSMFTSGLLFFPGQPSPLSKWLEIWSRHPIENHALVGASLEKGMVKNIQEQYFDIKDLSSITTLIMDGGGNDIMSHRHDCEKMNDPCKNLIHRGLNIISYILEKAFEDGIKNVIFLGYYYLSGFQEAIDYTVPLLSSICNDSKIYCLFVDPRKKLKTPEMLGSDGIHPNEEGYKLLAEMIWNQTNDHRIIL